MSKIKKSILFSAVILFIFILVLLYVRLTDKSEIITEISTSDSNVTLYSDVKTSDWYFEDVKYVSEKDLMNGTDEGQFSPYEETTRGMIVTILWRLEGEPKGSGASFSDVENDAYYYDAVAWAVKNEIVNGYDASVFGPNDAATREQMMSIIYRFAEYKGYDISQRTSLDIFKDKAEISDYAVNAVQWCCYNNIISGTAENQVSPHDFVQRCQAAAILHRFCEKYIDTAASEDVQSTETSVPTETPVQDEIEDDNKNVIGGGFGGSGGTGGSADSRPTKTSEPDILPTEKPSDAGDEVQNTNPLITVNSAEADAGGNVQVNVDIKNNPGILGMTLIAYYDETYCSLEKVESGEAFDGVLDMTVSNTLNSGVRFMWDGIDLTDDQIKDGTILVLDFHISDDAPEGKIPITLKCYNGDIVNRDLETLSVQIDSGSIIVKK